MKKEFDFPADTNKKNKEAFNDALPIGNGHIGAMIYGGIHEEKLVLNENTLWLGTKNRKRYSDDYYENFKKVQSLILEERYAEAEQFASIGLFPNPKGEAIYSVAGLFRFTLDAQEDIYDYKRVLNLDEGYVSLNYSTKDNSINRTYFASYPNDVLAIQYQGKKSLEGIISLDRDKLVDSIVAKDNTILLTAFFNQHNKLCIMCKVEADEVNAIGASLKVKGKNICIYISMATTIFHKRPLQYVKKILNQIKGFNSLFLSAKKDYQYLYKRQSFSCSDKDMTYLYNLSRYLMISSSRKNLPANLQGLWNQDFFPSWDSKYTININLQMNYWNVFSSHLEECFFPFLNLLERMYSNGKKIAKKLYHANGFAAHHNTDIYGDCGLQDHYLPATIWYLGAAWLTIFIYEYYLYTEDIHILKRYGYLLVEASKFILDMLIKDHKGYYILCPSVSPENSFYIGSEKFHLTDGCVMDDEIIIDLFTKTISVNEILNQNISLNQNLKEVLKNLYPLQKSKYNTLREWHKDYEEAEPGHRHISHLYGLYPSNQICEEKEDIFLLAKNTLHRRLAYGGGHTGWSKAWITAMYARLKEKEYTYQSFKEFVKNSTSRIGLDLHPPFQIDGNFGIAAAIKEMMIYEGNSYIELLPAIPNEIKQLEYLNVPLKHNLKISMWLDDSVLKYNIYAKKDQTLFLKYKGTIEKVCLKMGDNYFQK